MKKTKLYIITLEKIEQRYSKQWYKHWKKEFSNYYKVEYIDGEKTSYKIEKGKFLDINKTNIWKAQQVEKIGELFKEEKIKDGDTFIFCDGWHFGITALKYMVQLNNIKIKIYTYLHAGTWDINDFISQSGLGEWAGYNELGWILACDGHFVATEFHKDLIYDYFEKRVPYKKIHVVGFPMDWNKAIKDEINEERINIYDKECMDGKEDIIVFPHRLDKEKCPEAFDILAKQLPQFKFVKTLEVTKNKKEYYKLLKKARIVFSASLQETFGIGTIEAMMLGCIPIVPDRLSYTELYNPMFKYITLEDAKQKILYYMNNHNIKKAKNIKNILINNIEKINNKSLYSIKQMAEIMKK